MKYRGLNKYRVTVLGEDGGILPKEVVVLAHSKTDSQVLAFALCGGFCPDESVDDIGLVELALAYCESALIATANQLEEQDPPADASGEVKALTRS